METKNSTWDYSLAGERGVYVCVFEGGLQGKGLWRLHLDDLRDDIICDILGTYDHPIWGCYTSPVPPSDDPYLIVSQAHTPANIDTESEPEEAPSETKEFEASEPSNTRITSPYSTAPSDSITLLSPDQLLS
ncbi:hypothetical protein Tco_0458954 [Tanacetum coccineum]